MRLIVFEILIIMPLLSLPNATPVRMLYGGSATYYSTDIEPYTYEDVNECRKDLHKALYQAELYVKTNLSKKFGYITVQCNRQE